MGAKKRQLPSALLRHRGEITFFSNLGIIALSYALAFLLRFDFRIPPQEQKLFLYTLPAAVVIQYLAFRVFHFTQGWWRYVGVADFVNAVKASVIGTLGLATFVLFSFRHNYPRSVFILDSIFLVGLSIGIRLVVRMWREGPLQQQSRGRKKLLVIGAGDTGEALIREIRHSARLNYQVVAFLDDDPAKRGATIGGVPVLDAIDAVSGVVERFDVEEIIVATPSASGSEMRRIIAKCRATGVPFKAMPATWELLDRRLGLGAAREVDIKDLLRREPVELDTTGIGQFLRAKPVLVTGAAGSIGSEICRQVLSFEPSVLICLDHDENALFHLEQELIRLDPAGATTCFRLADITDQNRVESIFSEFKPAVVYHAAAHKHVPVLEENPLEGVRNNVFGTETVARAAVRHESAAFVLISTDKAVNPANVMGATKRIAELLLQSIDPQRTCFSAVRFGNVLGSQGSVVPIMKAQIASGGPITVTHPEMRRYFMTIPEAVQLVIQASSMGQGRETFTLDMGEPVRILDLARDLITLSGLVPDGDIDIVFTGPRPGEKLQEELHLDEEHVSPTSHSQIYVARPSTLDHSLFMAQLDQLREATRAGREQAVLAQLPRVVPEYRRSELPQNVVPLRSGSSTDSQAASSISAIER